MDIEALLEGTLKLTDRFSFQCKECGACCRHREDIILNGFDLFRIASALKLTPEQVVERYCESYIGHASRLPVVRLKPKGSDQICPLLKNGRCSVHQSKPVVCALYPLGRAYNPKTEELLYFLQPIECGKKEGSQTVQEWLEQFGIPARDTQSKCWHALLIETSSYMYKHEKKFTPATLNFIWSVMYHLMYMHYRTDTPFAPQLEHNAAELCDLLQQIEQELRGDENATA